MKKKLLIMVPLLQLGGQERVAAKTAELLIDSYDVTLAVFDDSNKVYDPNCKVINIDVPARSGVIGKSVAAIKRAIIIKRIRRKEKYDYVYSFGPSANLINVLSRGHGKTIIGIRTYTPKESYGRLERFTFMFSDEIVCCSQVIMSCIKSLGKNLDKKTVCVYNPLDIDEIESKGKETVCDYKFNKKTIVSHGRLDSIKNWPRLIKAFSIVHNWDENTQLLIIGEGEERENLENLIHRLGLDAQVSLIGFRSNPFSYISRSDVFVLSSYVEGFPNALIEGMVFLPVVSVDCQSGPREILNKIFNCSETCGYCICDYGVLVQKAHNTHADEIIDPDDQILADAIYAVLKDKDAHQELKKLAFQRASDFSCTSYKEMIQQALDKESK